MSNNQKVAVVTGASSGIGCATAKALLASGYYCVLIARNEERLQEFVSGYPGKVVALSCDVRDLDVLSSLAANRILPIGRVDALVNAAGVLAKDSIESFNWQDFELMSRLNVEAPMVLTNALLTALEAVKGVVVNVSSVTGMRSFPGILSYCVTKAAVDQFTRCAALELAPKGIRINAVNPGVVVTELHRRGGMDANAYDRFLDHSRTTHPLGRVGAPEEVAELILFLIEKGTWITGETICIDGGRHATCFR